MTTTHLHHALKGRLLGDHAVVQDLDIFDTPGTAIKADVVNDLCGAVGEVEIRHTFTVDGDFEAFATKNETLSPKP